MYSPNRLPESTQSPGQVRNLPPPVGGLNARDSQANMGRLDAVVLDNWVPFPDGPKMREGADAWVTGAPSAVEALHVWSGPTANKMFATTDSGIYEVTAAGTFGSNLMPLLQGLTTSVNTATGGGYFLNVVNGVDTLKQYDGTSWSSIPSFGLLASDSILGLEVYKQRLFFIEKESLTLWYLPPNSISGNATSYPLGAIFRRGGSLAAIATWTVDGGNGPDDHLAVVTTNGEMAVFTGIDPVTSWALKGVYYIARPVGGARSLVKYGGDLLFLSESGVFPVSQALLVASIDRTRSVSDKIRQLFTNLIGLYGNNTGWQMISHPDIPILLVNVPGYGGGLQLVMHSQNGSWCTFSGWQALCWARMGSQLYYGTATGVNRAWVGTSDFGNNITATLLQAYNTIGISTNKQISMVRPVFTANGNFSYTIGVDSDFRNSPTKNIIPAIGAGVSLWGTGVWGTAIWSGAGQTTRSWRTVSDRPGVYKALYIQVASKGVQVTHQSTDLLVQRQGVF